MERKDISEKIKLCIKIQGETSLHRPYFFRDPGGRESLGDQLRPEADSLAGIPAFHKSFPIPPKYGCAKFVLEQIGKEGNR